MSDYDEFDVLVDTDPLALRDLARRQARLIQRMGDWLGWVTETNEVECRYDHNGCCQAHFLDPSPCPMEGIVSYVRSLHGITT